MNGKVLMLAIIFLGGFHVFYVFNRVQNFANIMYQLCTIQLGECPMCVCPFIRSSRFLPSPKKNMPSVLIFQSYTQFQQLSLSQSQPYSYPKAMFWPSSYSSYQWQFYPSISNPFFPSPPHSGPRQGGWRCFSIQNKGVAICRSYILKQSICFIQCLDSVF